MKYLYVFIIYTWVCQHQTFPKYCEVHETVGKASEMFDSYGRIAHSKQLSAVSELSVSQVQGLCFKNKIKLLNMS